MKDQPALRRHVRLLSISFDPDYDTPARLTAKAREAGADPALWHFATAPREQVDAFGATFGLSVLREGPNGREITHNLRTALIDRDGKLVKTYNGNDWSPQDVIGDLQALVK
jgi:protein SCO1/2